MWIRSNIITRCRKKLMVYDRSRADCVIFVFTCCHRYIHSTTKSSTEGFELFAIYF